MLQTNRFLSPAKINLYLRALERRSDGFRNIESLFAFVDLYDEIEFFHNQNNKKPVCEVEFSGPFAHLIDSNHNLFAKIFEFFVNNFDLSGQNFGRVFLRVKKNIPVGAGLGGGSSNAATFIKWLNSNFCLGLNKKKMQEISLLFGSDIAFFFEDKSCIVSGRGEIIKPIFSFEPIEVLLINLGYFIRTSEVFSKFKIDSKTNYQENLNINTIQAVDFIDFIKTQPNDLTSAAIEVQPKIAEILFELNRFSPLFTKMSGSGSTCFAKFSDQHDLENCKNHFLQKFNNLSPILVSKQIILSKNPF